MQVYIPGGDNYPAGEWKLQLLQVPEENKAFIQEYGHFHNAKISEEQLHMLASELKKNETKPKGSVYELKITMEGIQLLQELLTECSKVADAHYGLPDEEILIETWTPDGREEDDDPQISLPTFNVGLMHKADRLKKLLSM